MTSDTQLHRLAALTDNYIWLLARQGKTVIVDPGSAPPVLAFLEQHALTPVAILLTHHHADHIGGVKALVAHYPELSIYGPQEVRQSLEDIVVQEVKDNIHLDLFQFNTISTPGHTLGHVCYYSAPYLFSGDTLFSAGCGRLFEGSAQQMYDALQHLASLPDTTYVCAGHEYTVSNLKFAHWLLPDNEVITNALKMAEMQRSQHLAT